MKKLNMNKSRQNVLREMERGRSMVEMLGVLAIIGVLSVMGIAGYTMAMRKYRANEIVQNAAILHIFAMAKEECLTLSSVNMPTSVAGLSVEMKADHRDVIEDTVQVCLEKTDNQLCDAVSAAGGPLNIECGDSADNCSCDEP